MKPGGKLISISGPSDPPFAKAQGLNPIIGLLLRLMNARIRRKAKRHGVAYSFLFMRADGGQLGKLGALIDQSSIHAVVDRTFPFESLNDAVDYVDSGRAKGKVVVTVRA